MTLIEDLKLQRELLVKQMFESETMFVQQHLLDFIRGYVSGVTLIGGNNEEIYN